MIYLSVDIVRRVVGAIAESAEESQRGVGADDEWLKGAHERGKEAALGT